MSNKKIKFAFIGCGNVAKKHFIALNRIEDAEIVGACDIDKNIASEFCTKYHLPFYADPHKMINEVDVNIINILTPTGTHAKIILELIDYGKHFVVEKPLALRLDEIDQVLEKCDRSGLKIFVVQQNRFNPPIRKLKEAIDGGRFGKLVLGTVRVRWTRHQAYYDQKPWRGNWALDGGVLTNQASHHIDMLIWMLGDVESVMAKTSTQLVDIETEDTGVAILKFANGTLGIIEATTATRPKDLEGSISILGEKGSVVIGGFFMNKLEVWNFDEFNDKDKELWEHFSETPNIPAWSHTEYFKDVIYSIKNDTKGLVDGFEGRRSIELISAIYESAETGREVFLRFKPSKCKLGISNANI
jgi:predicted dehydrogenase